MARYSSPFPLVGKGGDGGISAAASKQHRPYPPTPNPAPQGGGEP